MVNMCTAPRHGRYRFKYRNVLAKRIANALASSSACTCHHISTRKFWHLT